jgi:hypothetical protein
MRSLHTAVRLHYRRRDFNRTYHQVREREIQRQKFSRLSGRRGLKNPFKFVQRRLKHAEPIEDATAELWLLCVIIPAIVVVVVLLT